MELRLSSSRARKRASIYSEGDLVIGMASVGSAAAFSFAGILALAAVVAGLATAFAFTGVIPLAGMHVLLLFRVAHLVERDAGFASHVGGMRLDGERAAHQTRIAFDVMFCFLFFVSYPRSETPR